MIVRRAVVFDFERHRNALAGRGLLNPQTSAPDYRFFVSDIPLRFRAIGERFLNRPIEQLEMISLG